MSPSLEIQALTQEWISDPEGMPEVRREALLDAVRAEVNTWRRDLGPSGMVGHLAHELDMSLRDAERLAEEAGWA